MQRRGGGIELNCRVIGTPASCQETGDVRKNFSGNEKATGTSVGLGIIIGAVVGVLTDNVGLWIALGVAIGAAVGAIRTKKA